MRLNIFSNDRTLKYILILPGLLAVLLSAVWPLVNVLYLSFRDWRINRATASQALWTPADGWSHAGWLFEHYTRAFHDPAFWNSAYVTFVFTLFSVVLTVLFALGCALLLLPDGRVRGLIRSLLILPFAMSPALIGINWRFMFNAEYGFVASLARIFNVQGPTPNWLGSDIGAMAILISSDVWHWTPYVTMMFIGALASVPKEAQEAAAMDGANRWQVFWDITFPLIKSVIVVAAVLKAIFALKVFDQIYLITNGGPGNATQTMAHYIYYQGFKYADMGYASALSYLLMFPLAVLVVLHVRSVFGKS